MAGVAKTAMILGSAFAEILQELHAHAFEGAPGESDPFILTLLEREYIAYVLALYYQCSHCQKFHHRAIEKIRLKEEAPHWGWDDDLAKITLFLRLSRLDLSDIEWKYWNLTWRNFATRIDRRHSGIACFSAYAIGIARADADLMDLAFQSISTRYSEKKTLRNVISDIDRVTIFMKAATSKNRTDDIIFEQMESIEYA